MTRVAVLNHGMGNLRSVAKALEAAGADVVVTDEAEEIEQSDKLCVPGQGIFDRCMSALAQTRADDLLRTWVGRERPYLGICLGMQVLYEGSDEGDRAGLGVLGGRVTRLPVTVSVPHIGWNQVNGSHFYFDHSYAVHPADDSSVTGWCEHGARFAARVEIGSVLAVQFHPEKSSRAGIELLREWVAA